MLRDSIVFAFNLSMTIFNDIFCKSICKVNYLFTIMFVLF